MSQKGTTCARDEWWPGCHPHLLRLDSHYITYCTLIAGKSISWCHIPTPQEGHSWNRKSPARVFQRSTSAKSWSEFSGDLGPHRTSDFFKVIEIEAFSLRSIHLHLALYINYTAWRKQDTFKDGDLHHLVTKCLPWEIQMRTDNPCDGSYILMNKLHQGFNTDRMFNVKS